MRGAYVGGCDILLMRQVRQYALSNKTFKMSRDYVQDRYTLLCKCLSPWHRREHHFSLPKPMVSPQGFPWLCQWMLEQTGRSRSRQQQSCGWRPWCCERPGRREGHGQRVPPMEMLPQLRMNGAIVRVYVCNLDRCMKINICCTRGYLNSLNEKIFNFLWRWNFHHCDRIQLASTFMRSGYTPTVIGSHWHNHQYNYTLRANAFVRPVRWFGKPDLQRAANTNRAHHAHDSLLRLLFRDWGFVME